MLDYFFKLIEKYSFNKYLGIMIVNFIVLHSETIKINTLPSESPFHPVLVHFPIALTILIPFLTLGVLFLIKKYQIEEKKIPLWNLIIFLNLVNLVFTYFALFSGDIEHELLQHSPFIKQSIEQHERIAENFFISLIVTLVFSFLAHHKFPFYKIFRILVFISYFFINIPLVLWTGYLGGKIVYEFDAPFFRKEISKEIKKQFVEEKEEGGQH